MLIWEGLSQVAVLSGAGGFRWCGSLLVVTPLFGFFLFDFLFLVVFLVGVGARSISAIQSKCHIIPLLNLPSLNPIILSIKS